MLRNEALALRSAAALALATRSAPATIVNIGSSTGHFRRTVQPHIEDLLFRPLKEAGHIVVHNDVKPDEDVQIVGDISDPCVLHQLSAMAPHVVVCSNVLEHVPDIGEFTGALSVLARSAHLLISCPRAYPYHPDPIDNAFRPNASEISAWFPNHKIVWSQEISGETLRERVRAMTMNTRVRFLAAVVKSLLCSRDPKGLPSTLSFWNRRYTATAVLLQPC